MGVVLFTPNFFIFFGGFFCMGRKVKISIGQVVFDLPAEVFKKALKKKNRIGRKLRKLV